MVELTTLAALTMFFARVIVLSVSFPIATYCKHKTCKNTWSIIGYQWSLAPFMSHNPLCGHFKLKSMDSVHANFLRVVQTIHFNFGP